MVEEDEVVAEAVPPPEVGVVDSAAVDVVVVVDVVALEVLPVVLPVVVDVVVPVVAAAAPVAVEVVVDAVERLAEPRVVPKSSSSPIVMLVSSLPVLRRTCLSPRTCPLASLCTERSVSL